MYTRCSQQSVLVKNCHLSISDIVVAVLYFSRLKLCYCDSIVQVGEAAYEALRLRAHNNSFCLPFTLKLARLVVNQVAA